MFSSVALYIPPFLKEWEEHILEGKLSQREVLLKNKENNVNFL